MRPRGTDAEQLELDRAWRALNFWRELDDAIVRSAYVQILGGVVAPRLHAQLYARAGAYPLRQLRRVVLEHLTANPTTRFTP